MSTGPAPQGLTSLSQGAALSHPRPEILALTGLRGVAAVAVVIHHLSLPAGAPAAVRHLADGGTFGVPLFFLLSGFVLAYNYPKLDLRSGRRALGRYAMARIARIAPLSALAGVVVLMLGSPHGTGWMVSVLGEQAWFLGVLIFLYAAFPALAPVIAASADRAGNRGLLTVAAVALGAQVLLLAGRLASGSDVLFYRNPLAWMPDLVIGMTLAHLVTRGLRIRPRTAQLVQAACLLYGVTVALQGFGSTARYGAIWAIPLGLVILTLAAAPTSRTASLLSSPLAVHLGVIGLSVYLTHRVLLRGFGTPPGDTTWTVALAGCWVGLAVILAEGAHRYAGVPGRRWVMTLGRRLDRHTGDRDLVDPG